MGGIEEWGVGMTDNTGKIGQGLGRGHPCKAPGREHACEEHEIECLEIGKQLMCNKTMMIIVLTANIDWAYSVPGTMLST